MRFNGWQEKKDKVGERVAALQQLVSPFGKVSVMSLNFSIIMWLLWADEDDSFTVWLQTDTASVLQEATGYIKFLHEQLQVISFYFNSNLIMLLFFFFFFDWVEMCVIFRCWVLHIWDQIAACRWEKSKPSSLCYGNKYRTFKLIIRKVAHSVLEQW